MKLHAPTILAATILALGLSACAHSLPSLGIFGRHDKTAVIFATSDIRGALVPLEPGRGGAALVEAYYKRVRSDFGSRAVWLDAGELNGKTMGFDFDSGASFEKFVQTSGMAASLENHPAPSATLVQAGNVQLGIVSAQSVEELESQAGKARAQGAELVIWLTDLPIRCNPVPVVQHSFFRKPGEPNGFCEGAIHDIISKIPQGTVNAVIASGSDEPLERFIYPRYSSDAAAGVPVVAESPFGRDFHVIYLAYDPSTKRAVFSKTRIEGPVPVQAGEFHGHSIAPDSAVSSIARPVENWIIQQRKQVLATSSLRLSGVSLSEHSTKESSLGDLIADAIRKETQSDFAIVQPGMTQNAFGGAALAPGPVSMVDLERALPADASVVVLPIRGAELKTLVRISENGSRGFCSVSGMKLKLIRPDRTAPATDLDGDHKVSLWEQNRVLDLTDSNDDDIQSQQTYRIAVPSYLAYGGDDWGWASKHFDLPARIIDKTGTFPSLWTLVAQYLQQAGRIDDVPTRIRFENPPRHGTHFRRRRHVRQL